MNISILLLMNIIILIFFNKSNLYLRIKSRDIILITYLITSSITYTNTGMVNKESIVLRPISFAACT